MEATANFFEEGIWFSKMGEYGIALGYFLQASKLKPKDSIIAYYIGATLVRLERFKEALAVLSRIKLREELRSVRARIDFFIASSYYALGFKANAWLSFKSLAEREIFPNLSDHFSEKYFLFLEDCSSTGEEGFDKAIVRIMKFISQEHILERVNG
jgi:hypothetical protein